jgi:hypothetical protein
MLLALAAKKREQYQLCEPQFWRSATDAVDKQRQFFSALIEDDDVAVVLATDSATHVRGFAVARILQAPPVYDPGGLTCMIDDFTAADDSDWPEVGPLLLQTIADWAATQDACQLVVVTARLDEAKRRVLHQANLSLASEWWVGPVSSRD